MLLRDTARVSFLVESAVLREMPSVAQLPSTQQGRPEIMVPAGSNSHGESLLADTPGPGPVELRFGFPSHLVIFGNPCSCHEVSSSFGQIFVFSLHRFSILRDGVKGLT